MSTISSETKHLFGTATGPTPFRSEFSAELALRCPVLAPPGTPGRWLAFVPGSTFTNLRCQLRTSGGVAHLWYSGIRAVCAVGDGAVDIVSSEGRVRMVTKPGAADEVAAGVRQLVHQANSGAGQRLAGEIIHARSLQLLRNAKRQLDQVHPDIAPRLTLRAGTVTPHGAYDFMALVTQVARHAAAAAAGRVSPNAARAEIGRLLAR